MVGIRYTSTHSGSIAKFVTCEKCGHDYGYWMERTASGTGRSPFLIDSDAAHSRASRGARSSLAERLRKECDPVPCPECGRLQKHMIEAAREARFGWVFRAAIVAGIATFLLMIPLSAIIQIALSGAPELRLIGTTITGLMFPGAILIPVGGYVLRQVLGGRFNPNKHLDVEDRIEQGRRRAMSKKELARLKNDAPSDPYEGKRRLEDY